MGWGWRYAVPGSLPRVDDLLGPNFLQFLLLALAGALVVGNALALVRPPIGRGQAGPAEGPGHGKLSEGDPDSPGPGAELVRAPLWRTVTMLVVGLIVVIWVLVSLTR